MFLRHFLMRFRPAVEPLRPVAATPPPRPSDTVISLTREGYWRERDVPRDTDRELTSMASAWLAGLPQSARPGHLADAFPRIINRIALCWRDTALTDRVLDGLLGDERGGRKGFPSEIRIELLRLHALHERREASATRPEVFVSSMAWQPHMQASVDR